MYSNLHELPFQAIPPIPDNKGGEGFFEETVAKPPGGKTVKRQITEDEIVDGMCSIDFAVEFLRMSRSTIYTLIDKGELPSVLVGASGGLRRIPKKALTDYVMRK